MSLHVIFRVGETDFAMPAADVLQMAAYEGATRIPGGPDFVAGLVQVRGRVVPVVDLRVRFGLEPVDRGIDGRVVVVQTGERLVGLLADRAREVLDIPEEAFGPPPEVVQVQSQGFVSAVAQPGERLVMRMDFDKVIGEEPIHGEPAP